MVTVMDDPKNLLLVSVDCLRWDAVGFLGHRQRWGGQDLTPNLDRLCTQSAVFPVVVTAAPFTTPSHASVFCGQYPFEHGVRLLVNQQLRAGRMTLAEALAEWESVAVPAGFVLNSPTGVLRGFDTPIDVTDGDPTGRGGCLRRGDVVNRLFLEWLGGVAGQPWFAFLHYMDAHSRGPDVSAEFYADGMRQIDALLADVFAHIDLERTVVCIFGDHGEGLGDGEPFHGRSLAEAVIRVPVILHGCGEPGVHWSQRRTIDIAPTLLRGLGRPVPPGMNEIDLFDPRARVAYVEACPCQLFGERAATYHGPERVALRSDEYKYERRCDDGREQCFLVSPRSNAAVPAEDDEALARIRGVFEPHFESYPALRGEERFDATYLDNPVVVERLQELGYLG